MQFPPQLWRLVSPFLLTGKDLGIIFDTYFRKRFYSTKMELVANEQTVYNYGSKLETASPKFSQPGDFLTYILFVAVTILVGNFLFISFLSFLRTSYTARVVQRTKLLRFLKLRKIAPALLLVRHSQNNIGSGRGVGMVGSSFEKTRAIPLLRSGGCDSLHFVQNSLLCLTDDYLKI